MLKLAQEIIDGIAKETFPHDVFWIDVNEVDTFGWEIVGG